MGAGFTGASSGSTHTLTLGAALSAGDLIVLHINCTSSGSATAPTYTVSDSVNGSWSSTADKTITDSDGGQGGRQSVFSFPNSAAGTPTITITTTFPTSGFGMAQCAAFSGLATSNAVDVTAAGTGTGTNDSTGASSNTTGANELVIGVYCDGGYGTTLTKDAAFTLTGKHDADSGNGQVLMEHKDSGSSGTAQTATASSNTSTTWMMSEVVYKLSGAAAVAGPTILTRTMTGVGF